MTLKVKSVLLVGLFVFMALMPVMAQGYKINVEIGGFKDTSAILGYYFNNKMLVSDTIRLNAKGQGVFTGDKPLAQGVYLLYMPDKTYFDFLVTADQTFAIKTQSPDFLKSLVITGADESQKFLANQKFMSEKQKTAQTLVAQKEKSKDKSDSAAIYQKQIDQLGLDVKNHWQKTIAENPGTFLASFLNAVQDIDIPEPNVPANTANRDSVVQSKKYYYFKNHYFDNMDLTDDRLLRTPFFVQKVDNYFTKTIVQIPDTIAKESIAFIEKCRPNHEMFKFWIQYLFNMGAESKMMGMDAVVVAIGEKYYLSGEADWADEAFLKNLRERVTKIKPNLLGLKAHDLKLESPHGEHFRLSEVQAPYTIVAFWETSCGHCKKEIPDLYKKVYSVYRSKGVKVFAVYTQVDKTEWTEFLEANSLLDWINVYDPYQQSGFRDYYDIYSTPVIYILDKEKKIVAKRIAVNDIPGFFDHEIKQGRL
jgi:thiol-disulfide isomerase/thioredoxin